MASFTLPQSTQRPPIDPNVFAKKPGYDYTARADEAWREIEEHLTALEATEQRYSQTLRRSLTGDNWIAMHPDHPQYLQGSQKANELHAEVKAVSINIASLRRVIWNRCCTLYACLYHIEDRDEWLDDNDLALAEFSPEGIWQQVCPGHPAPGSWPERPDEKYVNRSVAYTGWQARREAAR